MVSSIIGTVPFQIALVVLALAILAYLVFKKPAPKSEYVFEPPKPSTLTYEERDPDAVETSAVSKTIGRLMVDNEWAAISEQIAQWEAKLASTPGGHRYHDIAAEVALSGLQKLIDDADHTEFSDLAAAEVELSHFVDAHRQNPDDHVLAALAARAHIAVGDAYHGAFWPESIEREAWRKMAKHFLAAGEILKDYDALTYMSPLLGEAHYLQAIGAPGGTRRLPAIFEDWIDLDPSNPAIYAMHAPQFADPDDIPDEVILRDAEFALSRTESSLGFGGYALFFLPLLEVRPGAYELLDTELLAAAMMDLACYSASQSDVNWASGVLMALARTAPDSARTTLNDSLYMLVRRHLRVVYPRFWGLSQVEIEEVVQAAAIAAPEVELEEAPSSPSQMIPSAA